MTPREALAPAMATNSNDHEIGASTHRELTFQEHIAGKVELQQIAPPKNLPGFPVEGYTWWAGSCVPVGRRFVLLRRELRSRSEGMVALRLSYSMYREDDPPTDPERLFPLSEPSGLSGASTIRTESSLGEARATSVQTGTTQSMNDIRNLMDVNGVVYGSTNPAPPDYGQSNQSGQEPSA